MLKSGFYGEEKTPFNSFGLVSKVVAPHAFAVKSEPALVGKKEEDIAVIEDENDEDWVWKGEGLSQPVIDSLEWIKTYREPVRLSEKGKKKEKEKEKKGKKMSTEQIEASYLNFEKWLDEIIDDEIKLMREKQIKLLEEG